MSALPRDDQQPATGLEASAGTRSADNWSPHSFDHDFHLPPRQLVEVRCECGHSDCHGEITIPLEEYEAVRLHPTRFLIKEGHEVADVVRVVGYGAGYIVVAKYERDALSETPA